MPEVPAEIQRLIERYVGKPLSAVSEADVIEMAYSHEELAANSELRERYESLRQDEAFADATAYIARARDDGIPVPKELVRLVALCEDLSKRNQQLAREYDRLRRERSRYLAKERRSLLPSNQDPC